MLVDGDAFPAAALNLNIAASALADSDAFPSASVKNSIAVSLLAASPTFPIAVVTGGVAARVRPKLFGLNIAKIVNDAIGKRMLSATLTRPAFGSRNVGALTAGRVAGSASAWACRAFVDAYTSSEISGYNQRGQGFDGTLIRQGDRKIVIFGGSLPDDIDPQPDDTVLVEGDVWRIVAVTARDPAAATFECLGRR